MAANPSPVPALELSVTTSAPRTIVRCTGKIIVDTCQALRTFVKPLLTEREAVVLDLAEVPYIDSSGLGILVGLYISSKAARHQLQLINLNPRVKELFRCTRLGEVDRSLIPSLWEE